MSEQQTKDFLECGQFYVTFDYFICKLEKEKKSSWVCIWDWVVVRPQLKNAQCKFGYLMIFLLQEKPGKNAPGEIDVNLILITD